VLAGWRPSSYLQAPPADGCVNTGPDCLLHRVAAGCHVLSAADEQLERRWAACWCSLLLLAPVLLATTGRTPLMQAVAGDTYMQQALESDTVVICCKRAFQRPGLLCQPRHKA
jgi:hypothetical protein